jgi:hypothetical protein
MQTVSSFNTINLGRVPYSFNPLSVVDIDTMNLLNYSSIMTYDLSGSPTYYSIDIPGVVHLSTMKGLSDLETLSTMESLSTLEGLSTIQALSTLASVEVSLDDIINSRTTLLEIEAQNKKTFYTLDFSQFKTTLYKWAAQGYPDSFLAYSFPVITPPMTGSVYNCSDGNPKNIWDYIPFCLNLSLQDWLTTYQQKVNGMTLSFSINENPYVVNIHVSRI